jgi:hypothetical protein
MGEEIAEVLGALAAAFVGTIILDMWLGGGLLAGLSPANFPSFGVSTTSVAGATPSSAQPPAQQVGSGGSGSTTGGVASANI